MAGNWILPLWCVHISTSSMCGLYAFQRGGSIRSGYSASCNLLRHAVPLVSQSLAPFFICNIKLLFSPFQGEVDAMSSLALYVVLKGKNWTDNLVFLFTRIMYFMSSVSHFRQLVSGLFFSSYMKQVSTRGKCSLLLLLPNLAWLTNWDYWNSFTFP